MSDMKDAARPGVDRRGFLQTSTAVAAGALIFGDWGTTADAAELPKRTLGRTGLKVTTISFGAILLNSSAHARVLEDAIDRGVNLVHVSPSYTNGRAIQVVGEVMKRKRDKVILCLKVPPGNIDQYLQTLNTDHVDILIPPMSAGSMGNTSIRDKMAENKQQGKARFLGFATHKDQANTVRAATQAGFWDCSLLAYNIGCRDELSPVMRQAVQQKQMGFLIMKAANGLQKGNKAEWQAGLRNLLTNNDCHSLCLGCNSTEHTRINIEAVMQRNALADFEFANYAAACAGKMCDACGRCERACSQGVAILDQLRVKLYADRGDLDLARELAAGIPAHHSLGMCNHCGACAEACHRKLDVVGMMESVSRV